MTRLQAAVSAAAVALERGMATASAAQNRAEQAQVALDAARARHEKLSHARTTLEAELTTLWN